MKCAYSLHWLLLLAFDLYIDAGMVVQELFNSFDISFRRSVPDRRNHQAESYSRKGEEEDEEILDLEKTANSS